MRIITILRLLLLLITESMSRNVVSTVISSIEISLSNQYDFPTVRSKVN